MDLEICRNVGRYKGAMQVTLMIYTTVSMLQGAQMKERVNHLISLFHLKRQLGLSMIPFIFSI
jgi:hypothetical protein